MGELIHIPVKSTFVISVSIGTGCYRHLRISNDATLEELSKAILWAFDFYNDHAHAFFMDNSAWSRRNCYYCKEVDEDGEYRHTCDHLLRDVLAEGKKFKYVFDFGDDWEFACRVLRTMPDFAQEPCREDHDEGDLGGGRTVEILREVGESPEQYR